jgi:hypothetical protein
MGLDIGAYSKVVGNYLGPSKQFTDEQRERLYEEDRVLNVYSVSGFEERLDGYAEGLYRCQGESLGFRAGSYSGYNWWRRHLSLMALGVEPEDVWADPQEYAGEPFVELINYSDCDGCIGPRTSRKLARDFRRHAGRAAAYFQKNGPNNPNLLDRQSDDFVYAWWLESYDEWQRAFELASDKGFVRFC